MYFDGSVMKTGAGAGLLFISPLREHVRYMVRLHFPASNNMAEDEALLAGLRIAIELGTKCLDVRDDSRLVVDQVMKDASCLDEKMAAYCEAARRLEDKFDGLELNHIARKFDEGADELAKIASGRTIVPPNIFARDLDKPSIDFKVCAGASKIDPSKIGTNNPMDEDPSNVLKPLGFETCSGDEAEIMEIDETPTLGDWRQPILDWIDQGILPRSN